MVSTSLAAASLTGVETLKAGGNAVDAAIAAVAMQCVAEPHMTGIGGDCFILYGPAGGKPVALNGSGRAPANVSAQWYVDNNFSVIPDQSAHAVTIPGAIDAWCRLSEDYGRLSLAEALAPAIETAMQGFLVTPRTAADWKFYQSRLKKAAAVAYLPGGRATLPGDRLANPALAETLGKIARHGRSAFYEGEIAEEIVATLVAEGWPAAGFSDTRLS
jgi:gamma-glutamyltranspeptidase/glutathione hydrolase